MTVILMVLMDCKSIIVILQEILSATKNQIQLYQLVENALTIQTHVVATLQCAVVSLNKVKYKEQVFRKYKILLFATKMVEMMDRMLPKIT